MMYIAFCVGQVAAPQLFRDKEAPVYKTAFLASFICFALCILFSISLRFHLVWENKRRDNQYPEPTDLNRSGDEFLDLTDKEQKAVFRYVL